MRSGPVGRGPLHKGSPDGTCEVKPEMRCVWLKAYERSESLPLLPGKWRAEFNHLRPPVRAPPCTCARGIPSPAK